jgi:hypothetical protein
MQFAFFDSGPEHEAVAAQKVNSGLSKAAR